MTDERGPDAERDDLPIVLGLVMRGSTRLEASTRRAVGALNRRTQLVLWAAGTIAVFVGILALSVAQSPNLSGAARGVFAGLLLALVFAAAAGWFLLWASRTPGRHRPETRTASELETLLGSTLRELELVRRDVITKVKARSVTRIPLGVAGAFALWALGQRSDDPPGVIGLLVYLGIGAAAGEMWAMSKLEREYRALYKARVLPRLAARAGDLTYRHASDQRVRQLGSLRILPEFDRVEAEDEIVGTHRGLPLSIVEAHLKRREGKHTRVVFDGLVIELTLPRALTGTTVVLTDEGMFGNMKQRWRSSALQTVRLEDPRFEKHYEVYSTDQIEARALLTPAFMERFMALAGHAGFSLPGALAEANLLVVALPKRLGRDLFAAPPYWKAAGGQTLQRLEDDIRAVLSLADPIIDLDFWAAGRKQDSLNAP
jgi:hypothetical protein